MRREKESGLIRRTKEGDIAAFGEIVRQYQNLVYATAFQILKDPALAEDVAQEAFVAAFRSLKDLRAEGSFPPWLRKITRNLALSTQNERRRFVPLAETEPLQASSSETGAEAETEEREADAFGEEVLRIVSSLSNTLRFPVLLCYLEDVSTADAARFLGIREGALRKRLHDGKKKLQERIVNLASKRFQEYRLPRDFARRCICGCQRALSARANPEERR
jgi:RNA polymerase sigma-70 factor (ECF subfamily)